MYLIKIYLFVTTKPHKLIYIHNDDFCSRQPPNSNVTPKNLKYRKKIKNPIVLKIN